MKGDFKPATLEQYIEWLTGWRKQGGSHLYYNNFHFTRAGFLFVEGSFMLENEKGKRARRIIVGKHGQLESSSGLGHNELYFLDGFRHIEQALSRREIPVYNDRAFRGIPGMRHFIQLAAGNHRR